MPRKDPKEWYAANRAQITAGRRLKYAEDKERISMERTNEKRTKNFCVDHDHKTGKIRGLLCGPCNRGLGYLHDSPELLERLAAYVRAIP
jgi:hypothetical protein